MNNLQFLNERINKLEVEVERLAELCLRMFDHLENHYHRTAFGDFWYRSSKPTFESQEELKLQIDRIMDPTGQTLSGRKTDGKEKNEGHSQGD